MGQLPALTSPPMTLLVPRGRKQLLLRIPRLQFVTVVSLPKANTLLPPQNEVTTGARCLLQRLTCPCENWTL